MNADDYYGDDTGGSLLRHVAKLHERRTKASEKAAALRKVESDKALETVAATRPTIKSARDYLEPLERLWRAGLPSGDKTGWPSLDAHYTVAPGQLTIVTGWPGAGKSEWLDALLVNLSRQGWSTAIFSAENQPVELHIAKMVEKLAGQPFGHGPNARVSEESLPEYCDDLRAFRFISPRVDSLSLTRVVETASEWLLEQEGKRGLVIDPWNELDHGRPPGLSATEYVSQSLSMIRNWGRANGVHVWIVAHPAKQPRDNGKLPVPTPDMISDSQHWWNKADCAVTVYRDPADDVSRETQIHVQKVRFKHIGRTGMIPLKYDRMTGRYSEPRNLYAVKED